MEHRTPQAPAMLNRNHNFRHFRAFLILDHLFCIQHDVIRFLMAYRLRVDSAGYFRYNNDAGKIRAFPYLSRHSAFLGVADSGQNYHSGIRILF